MATVVLQPGREKSVQRRHPWIFSGAIREVAGAPAAGETVTVALADGMPVAQGAYSPRSQIAVRVWTFDPAEDIGADFFRGRLGQALALRRQLFGPNEAQPGPGSGRGVNAYRLVNAESDGLPGVVVDRYAGFLVCQFLSAGADLWKDEIVAQLRALWPCEGVYERSDVDVRAKEGLPLAAGPLGGREPPEWLAIEEYACRFEVDVRRGHKTGFYLDQRENRALLAAFAAEREVLNCFAYTGAFGVWALRGGAARVTQVESSAAALERSRAHLRLNGLDEARVEEVVGDAFQVLRAYRDRGRQFDLVVLDPPKFADSRRQLERAARGYKDINLLACKLLRPGGLLFTFSCSGLVTADLFQKIVAGAALDAGREAQIIRRLTQAPDHPVALNFPEGEYLKGLICRVG